MYVEVMWGKTMISGWVFIRYYHPEGRFGAVLGRKTVQHQSNWRWEEGTAGKGTGSKTENIIILLYKSMVHMCLECCLQLLPERGRSKMTESVAVLAGVLQGDREIWLGVRGRDRAGSSHRVTFWRAVGLEGQTLRQQVRNYSLMKGQ